MTEGWGGLSSVVNEHNSDDAAMASAEAGRAKIQPSTITDQIIESLQTRPDEWCFQNNIYYNYIAYPNTKMIEQPFIRIAVDFPSHPIIVKGRGALAFTWMERRRIKNAVKLWLKRPIDLDGKADAVA
jgi:hypothetical protein